MDRLPLPWSYGGDVMGSLCEQARSLPHHFATTPTGSSLSMTKIASHKIASHKIVSTLNTLNILTYPASVSDCYDDTFVVLFFNVRCIINKNR